MLWVKVPSTAYCKRIEQVVELSFIKFQFQFFLRLLPFSALLLMTNQGGNRTSKVSSMLQKTTHVAYETKTSQNQNHGHFT